jgi:hypothetical protein
MGNRLESTVGPCVFALKVVTHKNGPAPFAKRKIENRKSAFPAIKRVRFGAEKVTAQVYKRRKDGSVNSVIVGVNHPSFRHLKCQKNTCMTHQTCDMVAGERLPAWDTPTFGISTCLDLFYVVIGRASQKKYIYIGVSVG